MRQAGTTSILCHSMCHTTKRVYYTSKHQHSPYRREDYSEAVLSSYHEMQFLLTPHAPRALYSRLGLHDTCTDYIDCLANGDDGCAAHQKDGVCDVISPHFTVGGAAVQQTVLVASSCYMLADIHALASAARTALAARTEQGSSLESSLKFANVLILTAVGDAAWNKRTDWMRGLDLLALRVAEYADGARTMAEVVEAIVGAPQVRDSLVAPGTTRLDVLAAAQRLLATGSCGGQVVPSVTRAGELRRRMVTNATLEPELIVESKHVKDQPATRELAAGSIGRVARPTPMRAAAAAVVAQLLSHSGFDTDQHAIRFVRHPTVVLSVDGAECFGFRQNNKNESFLLPEHDPDTQAQHTLELKAECIDAIRAKRDALLDSHGYGIGVSGFNLAEFATEHVGAAAVCRMPHVLQHTPKAKISDELAMN